MSVYIGRYIVYTYICSAAPCEYNRLTRTIFNLFSWLFLVLLLSTYATFGWAAIYYFISIVFPFRQERKKRKLSFEMINFCCVHTSHHSRSWTIDAERRVWLVWWRISHKKRPLVLRQHAIVLLYIVLAQLSSDYMVAYRERVLRDFRLSIVTFTFVSQEYIQLCSI